MTMMCRCFDAMLSLDGTLGKREKQKRTLFFAMNVAAFVIQFGSVFDSLRDSRGRHFFAIASALAILASVLAVLLVLFRCQLTTCRVVGIAFLYAFAVFFIDLTARARGKTAWPILVLVVDYMLVMQVPAHYSVCLVCTTLVYFHVMAAEEAWRFGLLDIPGIMPQSERRRYNDEVSQCAELPCGTSSVHYLVAATMVFIIDFIATRGFAQGLLKEQASMERTINAVQEIASLLAGYDVEQVAELLATHEHELPEGMTTALRSLEENLRVYKAYLPQTCLPFFNEKDNDSNSGDSGSCAEEAESISNQSSDARLIQPVHLQQLGLSSIKATLLTLNIKDTLHRLEEDSARFSDLFTTLLLKTLQATDLRRGMVDVFAGDRIHCSFNTSKQCAPHATSALHTATLLLRGGVASYANMGVATGNVLRGDMGCEVMRRFSMVGALVRDVQGMERAGRMLGCDVLCNRLCFSDAECEHHLRLLPCKVAISAACEGQVVAELVIEEEDKPDLEEWMYMIGNNHWEGYNIVVRGYLRGERSPSDVAKVWSHAGGSGTPEKAVPSGAVSCVYINK